MKKEIDMRAQDIDALFAEARAQAPLHSTALIDRVIADAIAQQPQPLPARAKPRQAPGFWASIVDALGGKTALAGLGSAAVVGVLLGFVQPTSVTALTDAFFAQTPIGEVDLIPGVDAILTEG